MEFAGWVGVFGFVVLLLLIVMGIPIFLSMLVVAIVGFLLIGGPTVLFTQLTYAPFSIAENYMFAVIPLFIVMGELAAQTGLAASAFYALTKWIGKLRGGLLMATIGANAIFGAVSSVPIAVTSLSVKVALPELLKHGYNKNFCLAAIATAGVLDALIPPSTGILIFCILTNVSVGRALVAGIIPGLVLTLLFFGTVWIYGKIHPDRIPIVDMKVTWRERFASLNTLFPILLLFLLIIGGMYMGVFTPTVGGAIGASATLIYAVIRKVGKKKIFNSFWDMVVLNCQIFPMIIGGMLFGRFVALSGLTNYLTEFVTSINAPPLAIYAVVVVVFILISFPMDLMPAMIITIPIFFPLLTSLGFDPLTIVISLILLGTLGDLTPPIGMAVYVVSAMAKSNVMDVYRGVVPWFIMTFAFLWLIIVWPPLTTWLPGLLYK